MTYEQNIRKISNRLEMAHHNWLMKGVIIGRPRAQAKEAIDMQAEAIRKLISYLTTNKVDSSNIDDYLFSQGLILIP